MLLPEEIKQIRPILVQVFTRNDAQSWLTSQPFLGNDSWAAVAERSGFNPPPARAADLVLQVCVADRWRHTPCWLEALLDAADLELGVPRLPASVLAEIKDRLQKRIDPILNAADEHWLRDGLPMFDRAKLRNAAREILDDGGRPVLIIEGGPKSGKSYSAFLFQYLAHKGAPFVPIEVSVEPTGNDMSPLTFAQYIVQAMGEPSNPQNAPIVDPDHRSLEPYKGWILNAAKRSGKRWLLVLDGFRHLPPQSETRALVQMLARSIAREETHRERLRLLVIDFDEKLKHVMLPQRMDEDLAGWAPSPTDVRSCFEQLYLERGRTLDPALAAELDALAAGVFNDLPSGADRHEKLNERVYLLGQAVRNRISGEKVMEVPAGG